MSVQDPYHQSIRITPESCWQRAPHVMAFPSGDDYALHDMESDEYVLLPGTVAGLIWDSCDGATSAGEVLEHIASKFEVDRETAWTDLQEFLGQLQERGFLTPGECK